MDDPGRRRGQSDAARDPPFTVHRSPFTVHRSAMLFPTFPCTTRRSSHGRRPSDTRSSGRQPFSPCFSEHFRAQPACHDDPSSGSLCGTHDHVPASIAVAIRQTRGPPVDGRSRHAPTNILIYDTTTFRPTADTGRRPPSDTRSSGRLASTQCFSEHFRIRCAGRPATNVHLQWREGEDRAVSRRPPGTARAVRPSSRIFRRAPFETPVPYV